MSEHHPMPTSVIVYPCSELKGEIQVPGDKSISHRAVMLSALAEGKSTLRGLLLGEDVLATISCLRELGVLIDIFSDRVEIHGVGLHGLRAPDKVLDCGNSGTTLRLLLGILSAQPFTTRLTGDASLNRRPIERVAKPLRQMGAVIEELRASETERVVKVEGRPLQGICYDLPIASAQVKSAILLAGLYAHGATQIREPTASRDHTERMLKKRGVKLEQNRLVCNLQPGETLIPMDITIPGDISSAAFFMVAAAIVKKGFVRLKRIGINPTRTGILEVLKSMGANNIQTNSSEISGEPVADLEIQPSQLQGVKVQGDIIPRLIDEVPILAVAMAAAQGRSEIRDAAELRVKESDRIEAIVREIAKLGGLVEAFSDGFALSGPIAFQANKFKSGGDHRIAMAMAVAATQAPEASIVEDIACIKTSYPEFFSHLAHLGVQVKNVEPKPA